MTNDEAKAVLTEERDLLAELSGVDDDPRNPVVVKALDIALWLLEREGHVQRALYPGIPVLRDPRKQLEDWNAPTPDQHRKLALCICRSMVASHRPMPRRNPVTKTEDRLTKQRMITRVAGSPPYEWVAWAIEQYATKVRKERSPACCELLDRGLNRDLSELRVIRTFAEKRGRGVVAESGGRDPMIQSFSAAGRYGNLPQRVEKALGVLRKQHVARAKAGAAQLSKLARSRQFPVVRGWRNVVERRDVDLSGLVLQIAGTGEIPQQALFDVCDCASDDMVSADVIRAIFADELTREGLAPDGWRERVAVHRGWVQFGDREVR